MIRVHDLTGHVVVVGSGLAGLITALSLAPMPVVLVTRSGLGAETSSAWAQGGIAASLGDDDRADLHIADTLVAGHGLCDEQAVRTIITAAPQAISTLERYGVRFDRDCRGKLVLGLEAAHCRHRIVHVGGDGAGAAIVAALVETVRNTGSITVLEGVEGRRLKVDDHGVRGLVCSAGNSMLYLASTRVVLATGGLGGLYDATTNPAGNFGQGIALAARAGALLADMEFVQFHPTALDVSRMPLPLVSEAVRGEGAVLINEKRQRFMATTDGGELAPRDVVARAIAREISRGGRVFLDTRSALGPKFPIRFPAIDRFCYTAGINAVDEPIPVRPAAHYHMGGVATDLTGRSSIPGLWVVGEAACTGLHGANRLASNSLLEAVAMGDRAARDIKGSKTGRSVTERAVTEDTDYLPQPSDATRVRPIASRHLGLIRSGGGLDDAIASLLPLVEQDGDESDPAIVALLIAVFAANRRESRGAHARTDFPVAAPTATRQMMTFAQVLDLASARRHQTLARSA